MQLSNAEVAAEDKFQKSEKLESDIIARVEAAGNKITQNYGGGTQHLVYNSATMAKLLKEVEGEKKIYWDRRILPTYEDAVRALEGSTTV